MDLPDNSDSVAGRLFAPLHSFIESARHRYTCHKLSDDDWVHYGILRVLEDLRSGCGFLQNLELLHSANLRKNHYFDSLASSRRLKHLQSLCGDFPEAQSRQAFSEDPAAGLCEDLRDYHIHAGDGHFHAASSHDKRDGKGKKNAVGHLHALNLRNQMLSHLALSSDGSRKKPHDMGRLKRMDIEALRQGARKGRKVLYIWDRAGIDFRQWFRWKQGSAIYFLSRSKKNMKLETLGQHGFDRDDPLNAGVLADDFVGTSQGVGVRRVRFIIPETGEEMEFLTNLGSHIPPGVIAQLYFMRWRIEKSFDELKNKLYEQKAWATGNTARQMQATFTVLAHNLAHLLEADIRSRHKISDTINEKKRAKRLEVLEEQVSETGRVLPALRRSLQEPSQLCVKFYRWLRHHLHRSTSWRRSLEHLRTLYARF
jgi:hypothetical protein